jgi:hypothetical protein
MKNRHWMAIGFGLFGLPLAAGCSSAPPADERTATSNEALECDGTTGPRCSCRPWETRQCAYQIDDRRVECDCAPLPGCLFQSSGPPDGVAGRWYGVQVG